MKIALAFTGISYGRGRDFTHCFPNIEETLIAPLKEKHEVSIFLCTYEHEKIEQLVELYKPTKYKVIPFEGSHQVTTYIKSMENLKGYDFDFVITTRFDIHFNKPINSIDIDYNKFNTFFPEKGWYNKIKWWPIWRKARFFHRICLPYLAKHVTDNFFAFPYKMLDDFISVLQDEYKHPNRRGLMDMHGVFNKMEKKIGKDNVNLVSKEEELSDSNSFYFLCRTK